MCCGGEGCCCCCWTGSVIAATEPGAGELAATTPPAAPPVPRPAESQASPSSIITLLTLFSHISYCNFLYNGHNNSWIVSIINSIQTPFTIFQQKTIADTDNSKIL